MRSQQRGYHHEGEGEGEQGSSESETEDDGDGEIKIEGDGGRGGGGSGMERMGRIAGPFRSSSSSSSSRGHALFRWVDSESSLDAANRENSHTSSNENVLPMGGGGGGGGEIEMDSVASGEESMFRTAYTHGTMGSPLSMGRPGTNNSSSSPQLISSRGGSGEFSLRSVPSIDGHGKDTNASSLLQVIEFEENGDEEGSVHAMISSSSSMGTLPSSVQDILPSNDVPVIAEEEVSV